jgi:hypothetical protein
MISSTQCRKGLPKDLSSAKVHGEGFDFSPDRFILRENNWSLSPNLVQFDKELMLVMNNGDNAGQIMSAKLLCVKPTESQPGRTPLFGSESTRR